MKELLVRSYKCPKCRAYIIHDNLYQCNFLRVLEEEVVHVEEEEVLEEEVVHVLEEEVVHVNDAVMDLINGSFDKDFVFKEIIKEIVKKHNHKLLIFSDYHGTFQVVHKFLQENRLAFEYLEGDLTKIEKTIDEYKFGNCNILLINSLAYGAGLNLEKTTDIILLHKSERKEQFIGRAQRIGRDCSLIVHELLYNDERI
jgi:SNF2 family DNA or RNA helicase